MFTIFVYNVNVNKMKDPYLRTISTNKLTVVNEHGEIIEVDTEILQALVNTDDEFYMLYSSALYLMMDTTKDVNVRLLAYLIQNNATGNEFSLSKSLKESIAARINASPRTIDNALLALVANGFVMRLNRNLYKINPRHIFKGGTAARKSALTAMLVIKKQAEQVDDSVTVKSTEELPYDPNYVNRWDNSDIQPNYRFYEDPLPGWEVEETQSTIRTLGIQSSNHTIHR